MLCVCFLNVRCHDAFDGQLNTVGGTSKPCLFIATSDPVFFNVVCVVFSFTLHRLLIVFKDEGMLHNLYLLESVSHVAVSIK